MRAKSWEICLTSILKNEIDQNKIFAKLPNANWQVVYDYWL